MINGTYTAAAEIVRNAGGVLFPCYYGETFGPVTDQFAFDIVPAPDRGPFVVTNIQGIPFTTVNLARSDRVQIRAGGNDMQFAPFLASAFAPINSFAPSNDTNLFNPILVPPGGSLFVRNFVEGAAGVIATGQITVTGFHTDARGARAIARHGMPWVIPVVNDHAATAQTDIQLERQMEAGTVELMGMVPAFTTIPLLLSFRIRGVEVSQGATTFAGPFIQDSPAAVGVQLLAKVSAGDSITVRTAYPAAAGNAFKCNLWSRRIYRQPNQQCN